MFPLILIFFKFTLIRWKVWLQSKTIFNEPNVDVRCRISWRQSMFKNVTQSLLAASWNLSTRSNGSIMDEWRTAFCQSIQLRPVIQLLCNQCGLNGSCAWVTKTMEIYSKRKTLFGNIHNTSKPIGSPIDNCKHWSLGSIDPITPLWIEQTNHFGSPTDPSNAEY